MCLFIDVYQAERFAWTQWNPTQEDLLIIIIFYIYMYMYGAFVITIVFMLQGMQKLRFYESKQPISLLLIE